MKDYEVDKYEPRSVMIHEDCLRAYYHCSRCPHKINKDEDDCLEDNCAISEKNYIRTGQWVRYEDYAQLKTAINTYIMRINCAMGCEDKGE